MESDFVAFPFIIGKAIYKKGKFTQGFWRFAGFPCIDSWIQAQTWESMHRLGRFAGFPCIDSGFQAQTWESMWGFACLCPVACIDSWIQAQTSTIFKYSSTHDSHHAVVRNGVFIPLVYDAPLNYSPFISQPYSIPLRLYNYQIFAD